MKLILFALAIVFGGVFLVTPKPTYAVANPEISCHQYGQTEASTGALSLQFSLYTWGDQDITFDYSVTGGTASGNGVDYTFSNGTATIPVGSAYVNVLVPVTQHTTWNPNAKTIVISISNAFEGGVAYSNAQNNSCTLTITENSLKPAIGFESTTGSGLETIATVEPKIILSNPATVPITITLTKSGVTLRPATYGADYSTQGLSLVIPAGVTEVSFPISIINDSYVEGSEIFEFFIQEQSTGAFTRVSNRSFSYTILDEDGVTSLPTGTPRIVGKTAVYNFLKQNGKFLLTNTSIQVSPEPKQYAGLWWAKRITLSGTQQSTVYVFVPQTPSANGAMSVFSQSGKLLQSLKPAGSYITRGAASDLVVQPSSTTPMLAFAHLNGSTVKFYEVTSTGLVARGQVVVNRKNFSGNLIVGYRKLYGTDYGLVTMVKGRTSTLQVWKYNPVKKTFSSDTSKTTLAKLKVTADTFTLK